MKLLLRFQGSRINFKVIIKEDSSFVVWNSNRLTNVASNSEGWSEALVNIRDRRFMNIIIQVSCEKTANVYTDKMRSNHYFEDQNWNHSTILFKLIELQDCVQDLTQYVDFEAEHSDATSLTSDSFNVFGSPERFIFTYNGHLLHPDAARALAKQTQDVCASLNSTTLINKSQLNCNFEIMEESTKNRSRRPNEWKDPNILAQCVSTDKLCDLHNDCPNGLDESDESNICGSMPFGSKCNFEDGWCGWINEELEDKMQWQRRNGPFYDEATGPKFDHTYENAQGHYLYVTSSGVKRYRLGDSAILKSKIFEPFKSVNREMLDDVTFLSEFKNNCKIRFWYHMFGPHTGALELIIHSTPYKINTRIKTARDDIIMGSNEQIIIERLWRIFGKDDEEWKRVELPLFISSIPKSFYLEFKAKRGLLNKGDVAIDDISLSRDCFVSTTITKSNDTNIDNDKMSIKLHDSFKEILSNIQMIEGNSTFTPISRLFDNCGKVGRFGPKISQCFYKPPNYEMIDNKLLETSYSGVQIWIVPRDGYYNFNVSGARGGKGALNLHGYGKGSLVSGTLKLLKGEILFILVGQMGQDACHLSTNNTLKYRYAKICEHKSPSLEATLLDYYERRKLSGGGGGGGGASYIFKLDNQTIPIPLLVAGGGGGASSKAWGTQNNQLNPDGHIFQSFNNTTKTHTSYPHGKGYINSKGAGAGGGWEDSVELMLPNSYSMTGSNLLIEGGKGGIGQACGILNSLGTKILEYDTWPVDGGFGGGGASCNSGGGGGGYKGGDVSTVDSMYNNGGGGSSYISPLFKNDFSMSGFNDGQGRISIKATIKNCPCSFQCNIIDPFTNYFECLCPKGMILGKDGINCKVIDWPINSKKTVFIMLIIGSIALLFIGLLVLAYKQFIRHKILKNSTNLQIRKQSSNLPSSCTDTDEMTSDAILDLEKGNKAFWDALNHEFQLDWLRTLSNKIPEPLFIKKIINLKKRIIEQKLGKCQNPNDITTFFDPHMLKMSEFNMNYGDPNMSKTSIKDSLLNKDTTESQNSYKYPGVDYNKLYEQYEYNIMEIPRNKLVLVKALGEGAFGEVFKGTLMYPKDAKLSARNSKNVYDASNCAEIDYEQINVAIKTLPENSKNNSEVDFLMEALIMSKFHHPNIVKMYGACLKNHPKFIVLEYLAGGDLKNFLREIRMQDCPEQKFITLKELLLLSLHVAKGCLYLEKNHFVHRDIAARNCLLTCKGENGRIAKIADFGMSRDVYRADYYRKSGKTMLPVKWMPPEAYLDGLFSTKSDVWAFGILLWEIFTLGYMPYPGIGNQEVMVIVAKGNRLNFPSCCPLKIREIMMQCWLKDPACRPNFQAIIDSIESCIEDPLTLLFKHLPRSGKTKPNTTEDLTPDEKLLLNSDFNNDDDILLEDAFNSESEIAKTSNDDQIEIMSLSNRGTKISKNSQSTSGLGGSISWGSNNEDEYYNNDTIIRKISVDSWSKKNYRKRMSDSSDSQTFYEYLVPLKAEETSLEENTLQNSECVSNAAESIPEDFCSNNQNHFYDNQLTITSVNKKTVPQLFIKKCNSNLKRVNSLPCNYIHLVNIKRVYSNGKSLTILNKSLKSNEENFTSNVIDKYVAYFLKNPIKNAMFKDKSKIINFSKSETKLNQRRIINKTLQKSLSFNQNFKNLIRKNIFGHLVAETVCKNNFDHLLMTDSGIENSIYK
ncbi:unnamed protein product [Gordionus sp. m RMFG-2023]